MAYDRHFVDVLPPNIIHEDDYYLRVSNNVAKHYIGRHGVAIYLGEINTDSFNALYQQWLSLGNTGTINDYANSLGGNTSNYEHQQSVPSSLWTGTHNLGRKVTSVHVVDTGGNQWECIFDSTTTTFQINVGIAPFAGTAILI